MTYSITKRIAANLIIITFIVMMFSHCAQKPEWYLIAALVLVFAPALLAYGYFIALLRCPKCDSAFMFSERPALGARLAYAISAPFHAPLRCYSCEARLPLHS